MPAPLGNFLDAKPGKVVRMALVLRFGQVPRQWGALQDKVYGAQLDQESQADEVALLTQKLQKTKKKLTAVNQKLKNAPTKEKVSALFFLNLPIII